MTGILLAWWYKKKLVLEYNGSETWVDLHWAHKKRLISGTTIINAIEYINIRYADYVVVVSEVLYDELVRRGIQSDKILINPNGVDPFVFDSEKVKREYVV